MSDVWTAHFPIEQESPSTYTLPVRHPAPPEDPSRVLLRLRFDPDGWRLPQTVPRARPLNISVPEPQEFLKIISDERQIHTNVAPVLVIAEDPIAALRKRKAGFFEIPHNGESLRYHNGRPEENGVDKVPVAYPSKLEETISEPEGGLKRATFVHGVNPCGDSALSLVAPPLQSVFPTPTAPNDETGDCEHSAPNTAAAQPLYLEAEKWKLYKRDHWVYWYHSSGEKPVSAPYNMDPLRENQPGDLFVHRIEGSTKAIQIWIFQGDQGENRWMPVHKPSALRHPVFPDLVLSYSVDDKHPKWIVPNTQRREKGEMFAIYVGM